MANDKDTLRRLGRDIDEDSQEGYEKPGEIFFMAQYEKHKYDLHRLDEARHMQKRTEAAYKALSCNDFKSFDYIRSDTDDRKFVYRYLGEDSHSENEAANNID